MTEDQAPLLRGRSLSFVSREGRTIDGPELLEVRGPSLACLGSARDLLPCLTRPERLEGGELGLLGTSPPALLSSLQAGWAPRTLPAPPSLRLAETLTLSARLVGRGKAEVRGILERLQLAGLGRRKMSELTALQRRLAGLAHGLVGSPQLLILEDPFADLDQTSAQLVEDLLEEQLHDKAWIAGIDGDSLWSRRLLTRAQAVLTADVGTLLGPLSPGEIDDKARWARFTRVTEELREALSSAGGQVTSSPHPSVLMIRAVSGLTIADLALQTDCPLLELAPASPGHGSIVRAENRAPSPASH